jgi:hypothetical protein
MQVRCHIGGLRARLCKEVGLGLVQVGEVWALPCGSSGVRPYRRGRSGGMVDIGLCGSLGAHSNNGVSHRGAASTRSCDSVNHIGVDSVSLAITSRVL